LTGKVLFRKLPTGREKKGGLPVKLGERYGLGEWGESGAITGSYFLTRE